MRPPRMRVRALMLTVALLALPLAAWHMRDRRRRENDARVERSLRWHAAQSDRRADTFRREGNAVRERANRQLARKLRRMADAQREDAGRFRWPW